MIKTKLYDVAALKTKQEKHKTPVVIGDVHGCLDALERLLHKISLTESYDAPLLFVGDILNRGPQSLKTLIKIINLGKRADIILGNHEMHFLKIASGHGSIQKNDTMVEILASPEADFFVNYLRKKPLCLLYQDFLMVHAGLLPNWQIDDVLFLSKKIEEILSGENWKDFFKPYKKTTNSYLSITEISKESFEKDQNNLSKLQMANSVLTRIRYCTSDGLPDWNIKEHPERAPSGYTPWFNMPNRQSKKYKIVFGHWSSLGLLNYDNLLCVDTGCSWGRLLTAVQLDPQARCRNLWQVPYKESSD